MTRSNIFRDISFTVQIGEILGFAGLVGAGRSEVARAVCGIDAYDTGQIYLGQKAIHFQSFHDAIEARLAYLTKIEKKAASSWLIQPNISIAIPGHNINSPPTERKDLARQFINASHQDISLRKESSI